MLAKILFISDLHKRWGDSASIKGQLVVQNMIQYDILKYVEENHVTHIVQMGDWYDRGFHGVGQAFGAIEMDRKISKAVNGNVYLCIGNHFYLERDDNPEMYIIQPHPLLKPNVNIPLPEEPIFKCNTGFRIGDVQISLFHFSKINKNYVAHREEGVKYHVGVYHDDKCVPAWVREREGFLSGGSTQEYLSSIYQNIDFAIHGHIHTKIGMCDVMVGERKVPLCIPGSLGITQNKENFKHSSVNLPVFTIEDNGMPSAQLVPFSTHIDELQFFAPKKKKQLLTAEGTPMDKPIFQRTDTSLSSMYAYMAAKGYPKSRMMLIESLSNAQVDVLTAISTFYKKEELNE